jgi:acetate kinase
MNILVFNAGSASLKFQVIDTPPDMAIPEHGRTIVNGAVEEFGAEATISLFENKEVSHQAKIAAADRGEAARQALSWLNVNAAKRPGPPTIGRLDAVGHRVVHGGDRFSTPVRINNDVITGIEELEDLAPLHNAPAVSVIRASQEALGSALPMVAVFDTEFHRSIPPQAYTYPLPLELARRHRIRRYGFHGVAHEYLAGRYARITGRQIENVNVITLHLESGCSACAVHNGQSLDTSMGFTPLEGLMMGMRSGDIDPSIIGHLMRKERVGIEQVEEWLNKESGLLGVSGRSHDTRVLMKLIAADERVRLAMEVFCYRLNISKCVNGWRKRRRSFFKSSTTSKQGMGDGAPGWMNCGSRKRHTKIWRRSDDSGFKNWRISIPPDAFRTRPASESKARLNRSESAWRAN